MDNSILHAIVAFLIGAAIATFNSWLTYRTMVKKSNKVIAVSFIRSAMNIGYLVIVFLVLSKIDYPNLYPLFGAAIGLTVPSIIFSMFFSNKLQQKADQQKEEGKE